MFLEFLLSPEEGVTSKILLFFNKKKIKRRIIYLYLKRAKQYKW